jgi:8-oxo-dGTP diphosphatase
MREYPSAPRVGVGAIVLDGDRVLLVQRGRPPGLGTWSIPGGLVDLGEPVETAVRREVAEECGLAVRLHGLVGFVDRIVPDAEGRIRYHYVLLDFLASVADDTANEACAGSDASAVRWATLPELSRLDVTEELSTMIHRAFAMRKEQPA